MARPPRLEYPCAFYHIISRGNRQQPIFHRKQDYRRFLDTLVAAVSRYHFHLYAYVLMPNHFHLLLEQVDCPLSRFMQVLLTSYAQWHNRKYRQSGHLFQGRYRAILCDKDSYLLELTRYIHLNPVRARIVKEPQLYPWSSYRAYLGREPQRRLETKLVLEMLSEKKAAARRSYERFVLDALGEGKREDYYAATEQIFLGDEGFVETSKKHYQSMAKPITSDRAFKPDLQTILERVSSHTGVALSVVVGRTEGEAEKMARELVVGIARWSFNLPLSEIANALKRKPNTISVMARKLAEQSSKEPRTRDLIEQIIKSIK